MGETPDATRRLRSRLLVGLPSAVVLAVGLLGLAAELRPTPPTQTTVWVPDLVVGILLAAVGAALVYLGANPLAAVLFLAAGAAWFAGNLAGLGSAGGVDVVGHLVYVHRGLVVAGVLLLRASRGGHVAAAGIVVSTWFLWPTTSPVGVLVWAGVALATGVVVVWSWPSRARAWAATAGFLVAGSTGSVAALSLVGNRAVEWSEEATWGYDVCLVLAALAALAAAAELKARPAPVADAVLQIALGQAGPVRNLLAGALRDPALELAFATSGGDWVDEAGSARSRISTSGDRDRVTVSVGEEVVAELSCRVDIARAAPVMRAIEGATRLLAHNALLHASLRQEADDLRDSQCRLLQVHDDERRALEARLTATIVGPMSLLDLSLAEVDPGKDVLLDAALERCRSRRRMLGADLNHLVAGLGPASLTAGGLDQALRVLTSPLDVDVALHLETSTLEPVVSTTIYLVCAEAVANVVKHADATRLDVSIAVGDGRVTVVVYDDGRGGVDPTHGTGLAGLADRVSALGGALLVSSPTGGPTTLRAELPLLGHALPIRSQRRA